MQAQAMRDIAEFMREMRRERGEGHQARPERLVVEKVAKLKLESFAGTGSEVAETAENWVSNVDRKFDEAQFSAEEKLLGVISLLKDDAYRWWESVRDSVEGEITFEVFGDEFKRTYVGRVYLNKKRADFLHLKQREKSVMEYKIEFMKLSRYGPEIIPNAEEKCRKFKEGLNYNIYGSLLNVQTEDFNALVEAAVLAEEHHKRGQARAKRDQEKKGGSFSQGGQSKKQKTQSQGGFPPRNQGNRGNPTTGGQPGRTAGSTQSAGGSNFSTPQCPNCGRFHRGECWGKTGTCFRCGSPNHMKKDCPMPPRESSRVPVAEGSSAQGGARSAPSQVGRPRGGATSGNASRAEGMAPARTYAMRGREEADASDVVAGTFSILDNPVYTLIDPGSTLSYICNDMLENKGWESVKTDLDLVVSNPLGNCVIVNRLYKDVPIRMGSVIFLGDLLKLRCGEFDVILGMDWLSKHEAVMDCKAKRVTLQSPLGWVTFVGDRRNPLDKVVSAAMAERMLRQGCEAYLAHVVDMDKPRSDGKFIPTVSEFLDVFPDELPGLPPEREVEFIIELIPGAAPISKAPYMMDGKSQYRACLTHVPPGR